MNVQSTQQHSIRCQLQRCSLRVFVKDTSLRIEVALCDPVLGHPKRSIVLNVTNGDFENVPTYLANASLGAKTRLNYHKNHMRSVTVGAESEACLKLLNHF